MNNAPANAVAASHVIERGPRLLSPVCVSCCVLLTSSRNDGRSSPQSVAMAKTDTIATIAAKSIFSAVIPMKKHSTCPATVQTGIYAIGWATRVFPG